MRANLDRRLGLPILAYPAASLLGRSVSEILSSAESQAEAAVAVAKRIRAGAAFCFMDLSVEAEAFGARVKFGKDSIPVVAANLSRRKFSIYYCANMDLFNELFGQIIFIEIGT